MTQNKEIEDLANQLKTMILQYESFMQKSLPEIDQLQQQIKHKAAQPDQEQESYAAIIQKLSVIEGRSDQLAKEIKTAYARLAWLKKEK